MKSRIKTQLLSWLDIYVKAASLVAVGTGLAVLLGWVLDVTVLKSVIPGWADMKVNTAIAFIFLGISLWLFQSETAPLPRKRIGQVLTGLVLVIGLLTLSEYLFGWDLGIDQILFKDLGSPGTSNPGRMSLIAAFLFTLNSLAVLLIDFDATEYLFIGIVYISLVAILGYLFDVQSLYRLVGYASTAVHTAILFFILSIGFLAARPTRGVMKVFTSNLPGSKTMRRWLLAASVLPIILGWLVEEGEKLGFFDIRNDTVVLITLLILIFWILIYFSAREQFRAEQEIGYQARLLRRVNDAIIAVDDRLRITTWNRAAEAMYGWSSQEVMGRNASEVMRSGLSDEQRARALEELRENSALRSETMQHRKDGRSIHVETSTIALTDEHGQITGFVSVNRDITKRKQAEDELHQTEQRYRLLTESIPQLVWSARADGFSDYYNAPFLQYLGKTLEEMQGWVWVETLHPDDRERSSAIWTQAFNSGSNYEIEYRIRRAADAQYRWHLGRAVPLRDSSGEIVRWYGTCTDIHDRKQAEEQIHQQLKRLNSLRMVDTAIISSFDLHVILDIVLEQVLTELGVNAGAVLLLNPGLGILEYAASRGFRSSVLRHTHLKFGEGYAGRVIQEHKTIYIADLMETGSKLADALQFAHEKFVDYYGVPLIVKGEIKGVLEVYHRSPLHTGPEWLGFLEMLAGQAAIAIDNAQLFDELQRSNLELGLAYDATIEGWSQAMDLRDKETEGHTQRVTELTLKLARLMNLSEVEMIHIRRGALLHDMGKLGVPDSILHKPGKLSEEEWEIMKKHPQFAYDMLSTISYLKPALEIPYCHHEKWDGTGYPRGLKGKEIPLAARLFAVIDVWDAVTSDRPYRKAWSREQALEYIREQSGKHFDPQIVEVFMTMMAGE